MGINTIVNVTTGEVTVRENTEEEQAYRDALDLAWEKNPNKKPDVQRSPLEEKVDALEKEIQLMKESRNA